jgi:MFS family permease
MNPKTILAIGFSLQFLATYLEVNSKSFTEFQIYYCVLYSAGFGLNDVVPLVCAWEWFPNRRGLVTGIILCCIGFGSFFFGIFTSAIVNPLHLEKSVSLPGDNLPSYFTNEISDKVPEMYYKCLLIWVVMGVAGTLMIKRNER